MTKVGDVIGPRTPSPSAMPWVSVVLPAPRSPVRTRTSPPRSRAPSRRPKSWVSSVVAQRTWRSTWSRPLGARLLDAAGPDELGGLLLEAALAAVLGDVGDDATHPRLLGDLDLLGSRPCRLVDELDEVRVEQVGVLEHDDVPGVVDDDVLGTRDALDDELAVRRRREDVLAAVEDEDDGVPELKQRGSLVETVERLEVVVDDVERGAEQDVGGVAHHRARDRRRERVLLDHEVLEVPGHAPDPAEDGGALGERAEHPRSEALEQETAERGDAAAVGQHEPSGARRDEAGPDDPLEDELRLVLAEGEHRHPTHRVPDEHDVPVGHELGDDGVEVLSQAVDRVAVLLAPARSSVAALVPADDPVAGVLEGAPLVDPAAQTEAVAVRQHDGGQLLRTAVPGGAVRRLARGRLGR